MNGRMFFIVNGDKLDVVSAIDAIGDGAYIYELDGEKRLTRLENVFMFIGEPQYGPRSGFANNLNDFISEVNAARYNNDGYCCGYVLNGRMEPLHAGQSRAPNGQEIFIRTYHFRNMSGRDEYVFIGSKGTVYVRREGGLVGSVIDWDKALAPNDYGNVRVIRDACRYIITYVDSRDKPSLGYARVSNEICGVISAFGERGVSTHDIDEILDRPHPSVMARLSEMNAVGRIKPKSHIRYGKRGSPSTVWTLVGF